MKNSKIILNIEYNLNNLELGYRIEKAFKENNILIEDILSNKYTLSKLYSIPNLGRLSVNEIRYEFLKIGFVFKDEDEWTGKNQISKLKEKIEKLELQLQLLKKQYQKTTLYSEIESKLILGKIVGSQIL